MQDFPDQSASSSRASAARLWAPLVPFIETEARLAEWAERRATTHFIYEFIRFGVKQAWACLFAGLMLALLVATHLWYPKDAALARYDFLVIAAVGIQAMMLITRLETLEEAKVILVFHIVGTVMEIFKTAMGSWIYPEASILRIGGVPLFTGFMYAAVGSFMARCWRLFDFRFTHHPPVWLLGLLGAAIYVNFFTHHYVWDFRYLLFAATFILFGRCWIYYRIWKVHRRMPLLLAALLAAFFIYFAENVGTFTAAWVYPNQRDGWHLVPIAKMGSWFLLMIISYALVAAMHGTLPVPKKMRPLTGGLKARGIEEVGGGWRDGEA